MKTRSAFKARLIVLALSGALVYGYAAAESSIHIQPYLEIGAGYSPTSLNGHEKLDQYYEWKGSNPVFLGSAGVEIHGRGKSYVDVGYTHVSNWLTGWPVNHDRESRLDLIHIKYRWRP